ncbi:MAG: class I SAM-dependent methyltransferase, partial [Leptospiraceae bacterium]|nr:class I SAM-dependent methyltransferase [Leptospiraceae bacterium]
MGNFVNGSDDSVVAITREYYNSSDADEFYFRIWGGEDIHVGIYLTENEPIAAASRRSVETMTKQLNISAASRVLDLGSGYGGAARYLAEKFKCKIVCLNLSETENERNRELNKIMNLNDFIEVVDADFSEIPYSQDSFDIVWSEDAILHSPKKEKVFQEVARILKPGGDFIFTDPMQADNVPAGVLQPVLDRIHLQSMGSF